MTGGWGWLGLASGLAAVGTSACCVLPVLMIMLGLGGSWLAVFAGLAAASLHIAIVSAGILASGWILALRRGASRRTYAALLAGSALSVAAWAVLLKQEAINSYLMAAL